jgi:hypothetical protein
MCCCGFACPVTQRNPDSEWGVKTRVEHGFASEKPGFGVEYWLVKQSDGRIIVTMTRKNQFNAMNDRSNGKSRWNA